MLFVLNSNIFFSRLETREKEKSNHTTNETKINGTYTIKFIFIKIVIYLILHKKVNLIPM
jgi:hypothetical protein